MIKAKFAAAALLLAGTWFSPALAQQTGGGGAGADAPVTQANADTVLASVNGEDITLGHVIATRAALPEQYQALPDEILFEGILEQLIQQTLLAQTMGELSRRAQLELENERRTLIAGEKLNELTAEMLTEEALQKAYEETYADADPVPEFNASHILVETRERAEELIAEINGGGDFVELAKANSTGPSGPGGGSLGWFTEGMMVAAFEQAVMALEPGSITQEPVQTQFGWHVIRLNEKRDKAAPPLEDVAEELIQKLQDDAIEAVLAKLEQAADIERADLSAIDPAAMRRDDLLQ